MNQREGMKPHELGILTTLDVLLYLASLFTFFGRIIVNKHRKAGLDLGSVNRGRLPRTMQLLVCSSLLISLCMLFLVPYSWPDHKVGKPKLEKLPVWNQCCRDHDCIPQKVKIIGTEGNGKIPIQVEEYQALVKKGKFFPVPSSYGLLFRLKWPNHRRKHPLYSLSPK